MTSPLEVWIAKLWRCGRLLCDPFGAHLMGVISPDMLYVSVLTAKQWLDPKTPYKCIKCFGLKGTVGPSAEGMKSETPHNIDSPKLSIAFSGVS